MHSYPVHFAQVGVHALTGEVRVSNLVACADTGIIKQKTAANQLKGGAVGGIGRALLEMPRSWCARWESR